MKKLFVLSLVLLSGCTVVPAKEIALLRSCNASGGIIEERYNPFNLVHPVGVRCVPADQVKESLW